MAGQGVEGNGGGVVFRTGSLLLRPQKHREDHHIHREKQRHSQPGHDPARLSILPAGAGDAGGKAAADAAESWLIAHLREPRHREAAVVAPGRVTWQLAGQGVRACCGEVLQTAHRWHH